MSNDEEHAPSAAASENEDDEAEADSDREQPTRSRKRSKTSLTKVEDLYAVSQRRQSLSAKAEDMSPQSMSAQEVSEALPPHGFPTGCMMTPTTMDVTVCNAALSLQQKEPIPSVCTLFFKTKDF